MTKPGGSPEQLQGIFGTDGVRGPAGEFLGPELATALGRAATGLASSSGASLTVLVLRDTRESSPMLEAALAAGITSAGGDVVLAGILPTPAASLLVGRYGFDLAIVISASHNPYGDNGIKFFAADGLKLSDEDEAKIEAQLQDVADGAECLGGSQGARRFGHITRLEGAGQDYVREIVGRFDRDLSGKRVLLDCANGATYKTAPAVLRSLGAEVEAIAADPDGRNINEGVGSTNIETLVERMKAGRFDIGFAFDGDGDRVVGVSSSGRILDGDELLGLAAMHLKKRDQLKGHGVAITVMSNYGLHKALTGMGIEVATTQVGDRYVSSELRRRGWVLGGEPSGHIVNATVSPAGDGIATALLTLDALASLDIDPTTTQIVEKLPQRLASVAVANRDDLASADRVWQAVEQESKKLEGLGRVLVRPSGTEPVIRVMVEAPTMEESKAVCTRLSRIVREELGK